VPWSVLVAAIYALTLFLMADSLTLFSPENIRDPAALARRLRDHSDPLAAFVWERTDPNSRRLLSATETATSDLQLGAVQALNESLPAQLLYSPERFAGVELLIAARKLAADKLHGRGLLGFNRVLLEQGFARELEPLAVFRGFKRVIATLGVFSFVLLLVVVWCSVREEAVRRSALGTSSAN